MTGAGCDGAVLARIAKARAIPHPGAQLSRSGQHEGKRYQVTATSIPRGQVQPRSQP